MLNIAGLTATPRHIMLGVIIIIFLAGCTTPSVSIRTPTTISADSELITEPTPTTKTVKPASTIQPELTVIVPTKPTSSAIPSITVSIPQQAASNQTLVGPMFLLDFDRQLELYDLGTGQFHKLPDNLIAGYAWAPDGCSILVSRIDHQIALLNIVTMTEQVIRSGIESEPVWQDDSQAIFSVAQADSENGPISQIHRFDLELQESMIIAEISGVVRSLYWHSATNQLYFVRQLEHDAQLMALNQAGLEITIVSLTTFIPETVLQEDASVQVNLNPVDPSIFVLAVHGPPWNNASHLSVVDLESGHQFALLESSSIALFNVEWSPNGMTIAFGAKKLDEQPQGNSQVYLYDYETQQRSIVSIPNINNYAFPSWGPDSKWLGVQGWLMPFLLNIETNETIIFGPEQYQQGRAYLWSPQSALLEGNCS